jgi:hypothetical protein
MINCEYCETKSRSQSGMAMHLRANHKDQWKGSVKASFSEGFDIGQREPGTYHVPTSEQRKRKPAVVGKGEKKPPINQECPWCDYKSIHPPGLAHHIKGVHPKKWKGRLSVTLGRPMTRSDKYLMTHRKKKKARLKARLEYSNSIMEEVNREAIPDPRKFINCCPNCGTNLQAYYLAARAAERHGQ